MERNFIPKSQILAIVEKSRSSSTRDDMQLEVIIDIRDVLTQLLNEYYIENHKQK